MSLRIALVLVAGVLAVTGGIVIGGGGSQPVHAENVSCDTGAGVSCDATLLNEDDETGYRLAVKVIGYDENGSVVTTYTNDATGDGGGIMDISAGGTDDITISVSAPRPVAEADVRVVDAEAYRS